MKRHMPQLLLAEEKIRDTFAGLQISDRNQQLYLTLTGHPHIQNIASSVRHPIPAGYRLLLIQARLGTDKFEVALVSDTLQEVVYYNHVLIVHYVDLKCRPATQQLVWRSTEYQHSGVLTGLPGAVFFDYILSRYDVIVSDNVQTGEGQTFWQRRLSEALARELHVYHYQLVACELTRIVDDKHLRSLTDTLWGTDDTYQESLAIISCKPLPLDLTISR